MESSATDQIRYDQIVDRLIVNFEPTQRLWPIRRRLTLWLTLEFAIMGLVALAAPRADLLTALARPVYLLQIVLFIGVGAAAAALALRSAIPGLEATKAQLSPLPIAALFAIVLIASVPPATAITVGAFIGAGVRCLACTGLFALLPWCVLFWAVKRGASLSGPLSGGLIGTGAFAFAFAATRLGCPLDDSLHVLTWHVMPIVAGIALSTLAGFAWLGRTSLRPESRAA